MNAQSDTRVHPIELEYFEISHLFLSLNMHAEKPEQCVDVRFIKFNKDKTGAHFVLHLRPQTQTKLNIPTYI